MYQPRTLQNNGFDLPSPTVAEYNLPSPLAAGFELPSPMEAEYDLPSPEAAGCSQPPAGYTGQSYPMLSSTPVPSYQLSKKGSMLAPASLSQDDSDASLQATAAVDEGASSASCSYDSGSDSSLEPVDVEAAEITIHLVEDKLWNSFYNAGNEMIVTKPGR